jgi:hypothetical protein
MRGLRPLIRASCWPGEHGRGHRLRRERSSSDGAAATSGAVDAIVCPVDYMRGDVAGRCARLAANELGMRLIHRLSEESGGAEL